MFLNRNIQIIKTTYYTRYSRYLEMTIKNRNKLILEIILISSSNGQPINEVKLPPEFDKFLWKYGKGI